VLRRADSAVDSACGIIVAAELPLTDRDTESIVPQSFFGLMGKNHNHWSRPMTWRSGDYRLTWTYRETATLFAWL
jgi:hypothetical protein